MWAWPFWIVYVTALAALAIFGVHRVSLLCSSWRRRPDEVQATDPSTPWPRLAVQLPMYNEGAVAARIIDAACALQWPRDRFCVQVLDDSDDASRGIVDARVAAGRTAGIAIEVVRRPRRDGFKAGALAHGLTRLEADWIAIFDADFVPAPDVLLRARASMARPEIGMIQWRWGHLNRRVRRLNELQAMLLDGHFAVEQAARAARGWAFNFNGTAGLWRHQAIHEAGGWQADTLTEDLDLSYRAALAGWRFVYDGATTVPAELPPSMRAFRSQQYRWAKGSVEVARKLARPITQAAWSWRARAEALLHVGHNLPYLATAALVVASPVTLGFAPLPASWAPVHALSAGLTVLLLTAFVASAAPVRAWGRAAIHAPALVALTCGISLGQARAVGLGWRGVRTPFVRTPKACECDGEAAVGPVLVEDPMARRRARPWTSALPELTLAGVAVAATGVALHAGRWGSGVILAVMACGLGWVGWASWRDR